MLGQCAMCLLDEVAMNAEWSPAGGAWRSGSQRDGPLHRYAWMCRIKCILQGYNIPFTPWQLRVYSHVYSSGRPAWPRDALAKSSTKLANQCARSLAQLHTLFKTNGENGSSLPPSELSRQPYATANPGFTPLYILATPCLKYSTSSKYIRLVLVRLRMKSTEAEAKACFDDGLVDGLRLM